MLSQQRRHAANAFAIAKRRAAQALLPKPSPADLAARLKVCTFMRCRLPAERPTSLLRSLEHC